MTRLGDLSKAEEVKSIFLYMLEIGFFDREAFKDKILTSEGIVERWYDAKRYPDSYEMPASVRKIIDRIKEKRAKEEERRQRKKRRKAPKTSRNAVKIK